MSLFQAKCGRACQYILRPGPEWLVSLVYFINWYGLQHDLQKSSANPLSLFISKLTGSRSLENQPITANLSKIPLYWHPWFKLKAIEITWLQIIGKWHADLSRYTRGTLRVCKTLVWIPLFSCSAIQRYFSRSTERKIFSHAQEWKLNRLLALVYRICLCAHYWMYGMHSQWYLSLMYPSRMVYFLWYPGNVVSIFYIGSTWHIKLWIC